jgi:porphobilinogen synthase
MTTTDNGATSPAQRPRRLRTSAAMRRLVREHHVAPGNLVLPVFHREGITSSAPIPGMHGVVQHSRDSLRKAAHEAADAGLGGIMVFGVPNSRDALGSAACDPEGVLSVAVRDVRAEVGDDLVVIADLCLDEFTDHGHCGVLDADGKVDNDATLASYAQMAQVLADAGAHVLGASGMMDGQVRAVRHALDSAGQQDVGVLAYAAKYASSFYGPFRNAVESPLTGDRRTYQQDPSNRREALREIRLDLEEGADIVMVKPAMSYLDIVSDARSISDVPVAAYIVSGEMAMVESAAASGAFDRRAAISEVVTSVRRAGADIICTYWAMEVAQWSRQ